MPREITSDLIEDKTIKLMHKFQILRDLTENEIRLVLGIDKGQTYHKRIAKLIKYEAREEIIRQGDFDCWVFWVVTGSFIVLKNKTAIAVFNQPGEVFGEMSVMEEDNQRSATVISAESSVCLGIDMSILDNLDEACIREKIKSGIAQLKYERLNITSNKLAKEKRKIEQQRKEIESETERLKAWEASLSKKEMELLNKENILASWEQRLVEEKEGRKT